MQSSQSTVAELIQAYEAYTRSAEELDPPIEELGNAIQASAAVGEKQRKAIVKLKKLSESLEQDAKEKEQAGEIYQAFAVMAELIDALKEGNRIVEERIEWKKGYDELQNIQIVEPSAAERLFPSTSGSGGEVGRVRGG